MATRKKTSPAKDAKAKRRPKSAEATKALLLDITRKLMLEEGYAAVSARRVAKDAGVTSALVHYYYPTTDDLLIALFRQATERALARLTAILESDDPFPLLWANYADPVILVLSAEFRALAHHRKALREELARYTETSRKIQSGILAHVLKDAGIDTKEWPPLGVAVLLYGLLRSVVTDELVGITLGHTEAEVILNSLRERLTPRVRKTAAKD